MILAVCLMLNICILTASATKYEVPEDTNFYCYMDYRAITDTSSDQWKLQEDCFTDICGFRRYIDAKGECYYTVSTTLYYSENIGDTFKVTFKNGNSIKVIVGDFKNPIHTVNKYGTQHYNFIDKKYCMCSVNKALAFLNLKYNFGCFTGIPTSESPFITLSKSSCICLKF